MSDADRSTSPPDHADRLVRFLLPQAGVRGVLVHLDQTWQQIRRDTDPAAISELLGEASAAAALFTGHAKVDGRLSIQLRGQGALRTLFAECTAAGTLRGIARAAEGREGEVSRDLRELGPDALLAITIENPGAGGREPVRYQGLVPIEGDALASAFEGYFQRSEQLPTRIALATDANAAAGLMLQKLPGDEGDADGWRRAGMLFDTLGQEELLALDADTLLHRLFHEEGPQLLGEGPLRFACSCSRERVAAMLVSLGSEEARAALVDGQARITCEFCGQQYLFDGAAVDALFTPEAMQSPVPERLQ